MFLNGPQAGVIGDNLEDGHRSLPKTEQEFRDRKAEFHMKRDDILGAIVRLKREKTEMALKLKSKGVSAETMDPDDSAMMFDIKNLEQIVGKISKFEADVKEYDTAIAGLETQIKILERDKLDGKATLTKEEYMDLKKNIIDLEERLKGDKPDLFEQDQLRDMLKDVLSEDESDQSE